MSTYLNGPFDLRGKVAVVIGATGELGGAIAEGLCQAGARTVLSGRNESVGAKRAAELNEAGGEAAFVRCNTTSKDDLRRLVQETDERFGRIDVLVNSAGVNAVTPFLEIEEDEWDWIMTVNLKGVFLACQVFGQYLLEQGEGGIIINISSMAGITPLSKVFTYSASKAALINLTPTSTLQASTGNRSESSTAPCSFLSAGTVPTTPYVSKTSARFRGWKAS